MTPPCRTILASGHPAASVRYRFGEDMTVTRRDPGTSSIGFRGECGLIEVKDLTTQGDQITGGMMTHKIMGQKGTVSLP